MVHRLYIVHLHGLDSNFRAQVRRLRGWRGSRGRLLAPGRVRHGQDQIASNFEAGMLMPPNFERLVLLCIKADFSFCKSDHIFILQYFPRSTSFTHSCTDQSVSIRKFCRNTFAIFRKFCRNFQILQDVCQIHCFSRLF